MKLKNKMLFLLGIPVVLLVAILIIVFSIFSSKIVTNLGFDNIYNLTRKNVSSIELFVSEKKSIVTTLAKDLSDSNISNKDLEKKLINLYEKYNKESDFFVAYEDKTIVSGSGWVPSPDYDHTTRDWYKGVMASGDTYLSTPYVNNKDGSLIVSVAGPIKKDGKIIGIVAMDISLKDVDKMVKDIHFLKTGEASLITADGSFISHSKYTANDNLSTVDGGIYSDTFKKIIDKNQEIFETKYDGKDTIISSFGVSGSSWVLYTKALKSEVLQSLNQLLFTTSIIGIIFIIAIIVIIILISKSIATPIAKLSDCIQTMANYDMTLSETSASVIYSKNKDEIGDISRSLITVKETMKDTLTKINDIASQVSASSEELTATSEQSAMAAEDLSKVIQDISQGAMSQAEDMQKGTMAMDVMGEALKENDKEIQELNQTSEQVFNAKENGLKSIQDLIIATDKVKNSSKVVGEVIQNTNQSAIQISSASDMIKSIADQTNLLALNAAIEAARAGEAGKGFAVVAEEIRKLAEQSNQFTEEIKEIVSGLTTKTKQTVEMMEEVVQVVQEQSDKVEDTRSQFNVISNQLDNTKKSVDRLNKSGEELESTKDKLQEIIENLSALSQENAASAEESSATVEKQTASSQEIASASANLADMAQEMSEMISKFKI
jgi:hypothetical protein